jgi:neurofibromin 1
LVIQKYSAAAAANDDESDEWLGTTADDTDTIVLHRFFSKYNDKIGKELLSQAKPVNGEDPAAAWGTLCTALVDIGDPLEVPQLSRLPRSEHEGYIDLMSRYAHRNSDPIREIFVETPMPQVSTSLCECHSLY